MTIERDKSTLLRGVAIFDIIIHNILVGNFGFVRCNEMTFDLQNTYAFFDNMTLDWSVVGNLFAFIGWLGVPMFVFLSGFGLQKKYSKKELLVGDYLKYNYLKLVLLMLPAVLFYIAIFSIAKDWPSVLSSVLSLSLFGNIWHFVLHLNPTVYWYFGLTWELYLVYILLRKLNNSKRLNISILTGGGILYSTANNVLYSQLKL